MTKIRKISQVGLLDSFHAFTEKNRPVIISTESSRCPKTPNAVDRCKNSTCTITDRVRWDSWFAVGMLRCQKNPTVAIFHTTQREAEHMLPQRQSCQERTAEKWAAALLYVLLSENDGKISPHAFCRRFRALFTSI